MKKLLSIITILLLFSACKKETEVKDVSAYNEYLSSYPWQKVSNTAPLNFLLQKTPDVDQVSDDLISITPEVKGKVEMNQNVISFIPSERMKSGQEYKVTLHLSKLFNTIEDDLKDFTCIVKTKELQFSVALKTPKSYSKDYQYVEGVMTVSDVFETSELSKIITAKYENNSKKIKFETSEVLSSTVFFKIDSLQRGDDDRELFIEWKGNPINASDSSGDKEVIIVGKNDFRVLDVEITDKISQEIEISFSDPIDQSQNLKGLMQFINNDVKYTYKINQNVVSIYPSSSFTDEVEIEVFKGVKNKEGFALKENYKKILFFEQPKPSVTFIKSGSILPNSNNLKINFNAVNLRAVDATIYRVYKNNVLQFLQRNELQEKGSLRYVGRPVARYTINLANKGLNLEGQNAFAVNLSKMVKVEEGAMYRVELSIKKEYSNYLCDGQRQTNTIKFGKKQLDPNSNYDNDYDYDYDWSERKDPCSDSYYYDARAVTNIFATNLGIIVKQGSNNTNFIAVTDLVTAQPVSGVQVTLYNFQQEPLISRTTDSQGIIKFKSDVKAFFAIASKGKNTTYIRLRDGNSLSMSKFDVSGEDTQEGIQGFIYGERGVWRPGDRMFLTFVLNDEANPLPSKHPIKFELEDPKGNIVDRKIVFKNSKNVYAYAPKTEQSAITGNWDVRVSVGSAFFRKSLKVETIKPNRLKVKVNIGEEIIKADDSISGNVSVKWMHGAIAKGLKIDVSGKFSETTTEFEKFEKYNFDDVTRDFSTEFNVYKGRLDDKGVANFSVNPSLEGKSPGMLKAYFISKAYEEGGDFSTDVFSKKVSPYTSYAGLNIAEQKDSRNYLYTDKKYSFDVASVTEDGKGFSNELEVKVYKVSWNWWWKGRNDGIYDYDGSTYHEPYKAEKVTTNSVGKGKFDLKIDKNDWGRFLVKIKDKKSGHSTSNVVYFDWPSWYGRKGNQNDSEATMLVFTTDKESYSVNETATVKFPSSEGGRALITIESGTEVVDNFWVATKKNQTVFKFPVLPKYAPNVFVNISLIQKHSQTKNDLPIRMYGSVPMLVSDPNTKLQPQITMPNEFRPESTARISVKEKRGKPMTYTLALVDEGLLDLTRFRTPNPWNEFYAPQSLGVKTWDIFDDVIGAYGGRINQILSVGGDDSKSANKNKKANRFKPMVTYLGPFTLPAGGRKTHRIKIPKYIGSVKAMIVASDVKRNAYGSAEKTAFVRKPLMILASLPRKITPKETVTLPITVFAMKSHIKNVSLSLEPNPSYTIIGEKTQSLTFSEPDEKMVYFKLKVNDFKGIGKIKINAVSGREKASYDVEIDVVNPNPLTTETSDLILKSGESKSIDFTAFGTKGTNVATLELSALPPMNFTSRLDYLIQYPHGCIEQTTSSAFPQLYFPELFDLATSKNQKIQRNVKATIKRLSGFQLASGGMSYWPGGSEADDWGTSYAGHFMLEASKRGYALPIGFKEKWIGYQKKEAREWRKDSYNGLAQAYRLYTLCLVNKPDLASMNRMIETTGLSNKTKQRLASAYALIGKKSIANEILGTLTANNNSHNYYYYGSVLRDKAMELETYTLLGDDVKSIGLAKSIANALSTDDWMSTQTTSYALISMAQFGLKNGGGKGIKASYTFNSKSENLTTLKALMAKNLSGIKQSNSLKISNTNQGILYVRLFNKGVLPVGKEKVMQNNLKAVVSYQTKEGTALKPNKLKQGTNFVAQVKLTNTTNERVENVALTQFFPSGWEIINTRFTDFGSSTTSSDVDYTDIRDASISKYFTLKRNQTKVFNVLLNASYLGDYYLPGIQAEAMYDNNYIVRTKGEWIKVVK